MKTKVMLVSLLATAGLATAQKAKSPKELEAVQAVFKAQTPDEKIAAVNNLISKFKDTEFKGFALSLAVKTEGEADKLFAAMSEGGQVTQPLIKTFFSPKFGMLIDKFGVNWMVLVSQG